ncbi:transcriptional regulator [Elstera cyanobacteriorum]|uniref:Transcriptional regulator n=1 Tax=Elstera cyanobacteriorum TaxID=2022747 RepID=A0A255Y0Z8_9PROT|nr:helix-turn-helix transcriptional regulator [Elstera cyanobacteriorum]OYQ22821.1 transcriptional regulator [Elstera cyanobacteriorum]GGA03908.1 transcriptional regulator [Elstera cyanobacteriorum]
MASTIRTYSRTTLEALVLMGRQIKLARKQRKMSEADLAERIGIARSTLQMIEKGSPKAEIGLVFEAAHLVGVPLFVSEPTALAVEIARVGDKLALLPQSIRRPRTEVKDDF